MPPEIPIEHFEVFAAGLDHPECVAFDRDGFLWAGGEAGQIYRISPDGKPETIAQLGGFTGGLAFSPDDQLLACNPGIGLVYVRRDGGHDVFATHATLPDGSVHRMICPNYPAFDRHGNLYVSDSGNWNKRNGYLLRFTPDGHGRVVAGPCGYANGLAISADESHLFMVESDFDRVYRFELHADGLVGAAQVYAESVGRMPDGLALDAGGNLYVSCYASDEIHRVSPTGERTLLAWDRWAILLSRPTNMALRGGWMYVANLGRTTITRARLDVRGLKMPNER
jgi:gluconolactonase